MILVQSFELNSVGAHRAEIGRGRNEGVLARLVVDRVEVVAQSRRRRHQQRRHFARPDFSFDFDRAGDGIGVGCRVVVVDAVTFDGRVEAGRGRVVVRAQVDLDLPPFTLHVNLHALKRKTISQN